MPPPVILVRVFAEGKGLPFPHATEDALGIGAWQRAINSLLGHFLEFANNQACP